MQTFAQSAHDFDRIIGSLVRVWFASNDINNCGASLIGIQALCNSFERSANIFGNLIMTKIGIKRVFAVIETDVRRGSSRIYWGSSQIGFIQEILLDYFIYKNHLSLYTVDIVDKKSSW
jgi:hypothetical protein